MAGSNGSKDDALSQQKRFLVRVGELGFKVYVLDKGTRSLIRLGLDQARRICNSFSSI